MKRVKTFLLTLSVVGVFSTVCASAPTAYREVREVRERAEGAEGAAVAAAAGVIPLPSNLPQGHPRLMTTESAKGELQRQIESEAWAKEVYEGILERVDPYVERTQRQRDWLYSRLMMYWKSKAANVYINGGSYSHADGEAPVATVRFGSSRGSDTQIHRPKIEDIIPYMDDTKGVYFRNMAKEGAPLEWVEQAVVSRGHIEATNEEIIRLGKDAAFVYWLTGDERYARFAYDLFDTYMMGMYYRSEPIDVGNGHAQTLVGMSAFEVIQERVLRESAYLYDFLYGYIEQNHGDKMERYGVTFKQWMDLSIKNGVPHNNWNLHQAKLILKVAMVLEDNGHYADGRGREYYIDSIINQTTSRQWSLHDFMSFGYDFENGVWNECPSYAQSVTRDLTNFIRDYDNTFNQNLLPYVPVMSRAVEVLPQYLFPNGEITAFGDSYYGPLHTEAMSDMIRMAQKYGDRASEELFTKMYLLFDTSVLEGGADQAQLPAQVESFFMTRPLELDSSIGCGVLSDYITPTFYAPNVSWFVQRSNYGDAANGLMISQFGSLGNHAHCNGVAMELYGKGLVLGADSGMGSSYFEKPYLEYYSQFPAHNTVMVDGLSKYPEMLSNHGFDLLSCYPASGQRDGYYDGVSYSNVYFLEPETRSDQNRLLSIVTTGATTGYYVDVFRSRKQRGGDRFHDYFYHNLGQELAIYGSDGELLELEPNDKMAFAGGHLFAFDYMWGKRSVRMSGDYSALWSLQYPDVNDNIYMNMWMKGYADREIFSIMAPSCRAYRSSYDLPYDHYSEPFMTLAARQEGAAWDRPFVAIFEPSTERDGRSIRSIESFDVSDASADFVGLVVEGVSGRVDHIFSSVCDEVVRYADMAANGTYAVFSQLEGDGCFSLFLGDGTYIEGFGFSIAAAAERNVALECISGKYYITSDGPVVVGRAGKRGRRVSVDTCHRLEVNL